MSVSRLKRSASIFAVPCSSGTTASTWGRRPSSLAPNAELLAGITLEELIDAMAVRLDGEAAGGVDIRLNIRLTEGREPWLLQVRNGVLHGFPGSSHDDPSATLEISEADLKLMLTGLAGAPGLIAENRLQLEGNPLTLIRFAGLFDEFDPNFNIVTP